MLFNKITLLLLPLVALTAGQNETPGIEPVVNISQGQVVGQVAESGNYFEFYGIPYADSSSGSNRFKAPNPPPSFSEEFFVATRKDIKCVRPLGVGYEGTEDCLVANVLTPNLNDTANLPVMVWIKGKEFDQANEPQLSFKHFVEKEVVVVSLNFRESILGFLCLGTENVPGNAGLKDIIAGLRWVQENIVQFGGNPNDVTLFGHGSGAAAVDLVTLSPMSNGLVHKAIAQSGTAISPWAVTRDNLEYAIQVAEALGHDVTSVDELSEVFTRTSVAALMAVINELDLTDNSLAFAPCVEKEDLQGIEHFLLKSPYQTIIDGDYAKIPFLTGFVEVEGTIRAEKAVQDNWLERMETVFEDFLQPDLKFQNDNERNVVANQIKTFYFGEQSVAIDDYLKYHGETMIVVSAIREARLRAAVSDSSIYLYQFSYKGDLGHSFASGPLEVERAAHSEDLAYLFYENDENVPELDLTVSDILIERWTNFAKIGVPISETSAVPWDPFTLENPSYLLILDDDQGANASLEVELLNPHENTVNFWNSIYEEHFLDAYGQWDLSDRNDDDDEIITPAPDGSAEITPGPDDNEVITPAPDNTDGSTEATLDPDDGDDDDDDSGSATTAAGYTFTIIALFGIINQFHWSQVLS